MDFKALLKLMVHKNASDLFVTTALPPSLKINGRIVPVTQTPLSPEQAKELIFSVMNTKQLKEYQETHESNFAVSAPGTGRFRVNVFQQRNHVAMVIRKIEVRIPSLDELNMPPVIKELAMTLRGLIMFVGGTGTGKSTSLAAMIGYRNQNSSGHIITIEDPIEYIHQHAGCIISQREVGVDTETFDIALKNTLRQAPDVILIGEVRARETMELAIVFAETGHLCLCTLHANNANQALDRIINFFPEDRKPQLLMDLSLNLKSIISQRLLPRRDGKGRRVAVEILINSPHIADLILKGDVIGVKEAMKKATESGMQTFDQALFELARTREIAEEDAIHYADSANEVRLMLKLAREDALLESAASVDHLTLSEPDTYDGSIGGGGKQSDY